MADLGKISNKAIADVAKWNNKAIADINDIDNLNISLGSTIIIDFQYSNPTPDIDTSDQWRADNPMVMSGRISGDIITLNYSFDVLVESSGPGTNAVITYSRNGGTFNSIGTYTSDTSSTFNITGVDYNDTIEIRVELNLFDDQSDSVSCDITIDGGTFTAGSGTITASGTTTWYTILSP